MKMIDRFLDSKYSLYAAIGAGVLCGAAIGLSF